MTDAPASLDAMIAEMEISILGAEDWQQRALSKEIKRSADAIARHAQRLGVKRDVLALLKQIKQREAA